MKLSIIIPVYNENQTLPSLLQEVLAAPLPDHMEKEILIIDDGSNDGSTDQLKELDGYPSIKILKHKTNQGKGAALRTGMNEATGDIVLIQDADLEYSPRHYEDLLSPLLKGKSDVVYGSRFLGEIKDMTAVNWIANKISSWTFNILFQTKLTDINTGFKVFPREILNHIKIKARDFDFETEFTAKIVRKGFSILEIPIQYSARNKPQGKKMNWFRALAMYGAILKYRFCAE